MSGNSDMQRVLKGVVRDHRVPADYKYHFVQPYHTSTFIKNLKRFLSVRIITKQNIWIPIYTAFVSSLATKYNFNIGFLSTLLLGFLFVAIQTDWIFATSLARTKLNVQKGQLRTPTHCQSEPRQLV